MAFQIEVLVTIHGEDSWVPVRPSSNREPYRYATRDEAERMRRICYGSRYIANAWGAESDKETNRVVEVPEHE